MGKAKYVRPELVFVEFCDDVIATSVMETDAEWKWGEDVFD